MGIDMGAPRVRFLQDGSAAALPSARGKWLLCLGARPVSDQGSAGRGEGCWIQWIVGRGNLTCPSVTGRAGWQYLQDPVLLLCKDCSHVTDWGGEKIHFLLPRGKHSGSGNISIFSLVLPSLFLSLCLPPSYLLTPTVKNVHWTFTEQLLCIIFDVWFTNHQQVKILLKVKSNKFNSGLTCPLPSPLPLSLPHAPINPHTVISRPRCHYH